MPDIISLKMLGAAGLASYAAARVMARMDRLSYYRYAVVAVPTHNMPKMPKGFRVEALSLEDLKQHEIDVTADVQRQRIADGLICLAAFNRKDALVGVTWVAERYYTEQDVNIRYLVPDHACWDTGLWIKPEYRLSRAFAALWAGVAEWMDARGFTWSISTISDYNLPSLMSHKRMQARTLGHVVVLRLFNWQFATTVTPRFARPGNSPAAELDIGRLLAA